MVLVHMTGDERWLEPPYKPKRDVRLIPDPQAGVPPEIQAEIRAAVLKLFENGEPKPVITDPGNELMLKMMRATLGENVAPEYAPLMREEMGFIPREARWTKPPSSEKLAQQHVLIVGAGVCAIALGVALGRLGIPYTIVEKNAELGGTWYVNRYPGCGVDTPNHSYSFSFGARNPWTRYFAQRQELLDYLKKVALEYDIRKHLRLNTELKSSHWDESKRRWISTLKTANGEEIFESTTLVSAIGQLNDPHPRTSRARRISRVRCCTRPCGPMTSSSTANMSPSSAPVQPRCSWCPRSPTASLPSPSTNAPRNGRAPWQAIPIPSPKAHDGCSRICRFTCSGIASTCSGATATACLPFLRKDPDWPHPERAVNKGNDRHREELTDFILSELKDRPDLIEKCVPTYPPYGKRILLDNNWFKTLTKPNVELVTDKIDHFAAGRHRCFGRQIAAGRRHRDFDGFKVTEMAARLNISGRDGKNLEGGVGQRQPDRLSRSHRAGLSELLRDARSEFRPRAWRQRDLSIRMPEPLHLCLPRRNDGA